MQKEGLFVSILDMLRRVPRRMLMVLKINDLTRSLDLNLHTTHGTARPFIIAARYCARAVWEDDREQLRQRRRKHGLSFGLLRDWIGAYWNYLYFNRGLMVFEALSDFNARRRKIFSFTRAFASGGGGEAARRAASGIDSQTQQRAKDDAATLRARKSIADEAERH
jgi:aarF domain-containing kinase